MRSAVAAGLLLLALPAGTGAQAQQTATPAFDPALSAAIDRLPALLAGSVAPEDYFAPSFLQAVPVEQFRSIVAQLVTQYGHPQGVTARRNGPVPYSAEVTMAFERADVTILVQTAQQGSVIGLRIVDVATRDDSFDRLTADLAALPGSVGWGLYRIADDGAATLLRGSNTAQSMAIGSVFKLTILGALDQEIAAGRMRWTDVVRLDRQSVPAGISIAWPANSPVTLHTLATLMISQSDNRATDVLMHHLGRERVEAFARAHGGLSGPNAFPLLSTLEATVLKSPRLGAPRERWLAGNETSRRSILREFADTWSPADVDWSAFSEGPADIDSIEWFGSADSVAALLGWMAQRASTETQAILSVNPGIPPATASRWSFVGYKGGSEPGVMAMSLLLRDAAGNAYAVSMAWNTMSGTVDEARMAMLATRAAALLGPVPQR